MEKTFKKSIAEMLKYMTANGLDANPLPKVKICKDIHEGPACLHPTGDYEPATQTITLQVNGRHEKDVLKTLAHEMIHHEQNLRGALDEASMQETGDGYAQNNEHLREMEREAYERSAMLFRDWTDNKKSLDEKKSEFKEGDKVKLTLKGLQKMNRHRTPGISNDYSRSLGKIRQNDIVGTVEKVFPSGSMNVRFDGVLYDIKDYMVVKE